MSTRALSRAVALSTLQLFVPACEAGGSAGADGSPGSDDGSPGSESDGSQPASDGFEILDVSPSDGATNVDPETDVVVRFSRPVDNTTLMGDIDPPDVDFDLEWSEDDTVLTVAFHWPLTEAQSYTVEIAGILDRDGNSLENPTRWCFSTGDTVECTPELECMPVDTTDALVDAWPDVDYEPLFASDSPWNTPIAADATVHPESDAMIGAFAQAWEGFGGMWLGVRHDVVPIYIADADAPRHDIPLSSPGHDQDVLTGVPIPPGALTDCGADRFFVTYDPDADRFYELFRSTQQDGEWTAQTGNAIDNSSSGIYPGDGHRSAEGVRASGFSLAAGLVWPHELDAGRIEHALVVGYSFVKSGDPWLPATASDGAFDDPGAIPMGARLQLDPTIDVDTLGLPPHEATIARALQEFGMLVGDSAGGIGLSVVHPYSFAGDPYDGLLPDTVDVEGGTLMNHLSPADFRVLAP